MIPYINTPWGSIPTFTVFVVIGVLSMLMIVCVLLSKAENKEMEEIFIFPKIIICGISGFVFAGIFDAIAKIKELGEFKISGISFYGGLIGAVISFYIVLKFSRGKTQYSIREWYNLMTLPLISFHFYGRLGCFFGGCCYGKKTDSFIGVLFPDNVNQNIFHNGIKCYPTQLFEAMALMMIFIVIMFVSEKFELYLLLYSVSRFIIEFFRGDNRGYFIELLSPSQFVSVVIFSIIMIRKLYKRFVRATLNCPN